MKVLRNILLMVFPLLIMINLYRFVFNGDDYTFHGLSYLHLNLQTFPGLDLTFKVINQVQSYATEFSSIKIGSVLDVFNAVNKIFTIIGTAFSVPLVLIANVFMNIWWFIDIMFLR